MTSLFNSSITRTFHCLLIQEPYLHWANHLPKTDPNWHMVPPLMNLDPSSTGDSRVKGVVYINTQLPSHSFSPISTNSPLIAGATLALPLPHPPLHLLSAYIPPGPAQEMHHLKPILASLRPNPVLLGMDSNLHHELWNPITYHHTH